MLHTEIHQLLKQYDKAPVECDGFTRLAHTALTNAGVAHTCKMGRIVSADGLREIPVHYWIELADGLVIDYRARLWLGEDETVPHGVFNPVGCTAWLYQGVAIELPTLSPVMAKFMIMNLSNEPL